MLSEVPISFYIFHLNHYNNLEVELTQNLRGADESVFTARVYFRTGFKNNTPDEAIIVKNNKLYSLRSLLELTSFLVDAEPKVKNKPQTAMTTPNGVFIVLMTLQLFIKDITFVVGRSRYT